MRRHRREWPEEDRGRYQGRRSHHSEEPHSSYSWPGSRGGWSRPNLVTPPLVGHAAAGSPMAASVDFKTYVDLACRAAEEFVNIYYETMDKRRRALTRLYLDKATLIWNGNVVTGLDALTNFFEMLPSSEFQVNMLDCQPVHEQATQSQTTVLVVTSGTVKFDGNKQHYFNQNFLLTAQSSPTNTVWKIASDCFRFQDWAGS
ncbi:NTF2-related export protein 2-like [Nycticebus coucang]|uniref:NTF2-related export protein 2-like n=1 Tax=Nycticebus coucang TaxID=9470 RepID=UPI00234C9D42|nr:NTF2-related export protein 2-like [Nycticebus coucang]XP_053420216.1 NTF2-related export protein 2-like [Nycticebus coucang]